MIVDDQPVSIRVEAGEGSTTSEQAVSMGLIATELTMNALKHAFPGGARGNIVVGFESTASPSNKVPYILQYTVIKHHI
jgi:two-component sensor histidine kinase